jgi:hypothetical protein
MRRIVLVAALSAIAVSSANAQQLKLSFNHGQVSIEATSVPARVILDEWSRVGGTKVVNGDRIAGAPLTLRLVDVPEARALEIILRSVSGYMAAPRGGVPGASMYDRILVMPTSSAPAVASARPAAPAAPGPAAGTQRFIPPRLAPPMPAESAPEETPEEEPAQPVFTFPTPGQGAFRPGFRPPQGVGVSPGNADQTAPEPASPGAAAAGTGVVGAPVPGMILQPARPSQPRPPGR